VGVRDTEVAAAVVTVVEVPGMIGVDDPADEFAVDVLGPLAFLAARASLPSPQDEQSRLSANRLMDDAIAALRR
jgi:hypothetical protein